jgi:protein-S-isoprenylcysteine O-methyltransferase Ste14
MTATIAKIVWAVCVAGWYLIRLPHERRSRRTAVVNNRRDGMEAALLTVSFAGLGLIPGAYVVTGFDSLADYPFRPAQGWIGTALFAAALYVFYRTHRQLGRNWSVTLKVRDQHRLVTEGIYAHVRHPMYSAFFLWALAQACLLANWIAGPAGLVGFGILFAFRVGREERMMAETFGEAYREYAARTKRLVPWVY